MQTISFNKNTILLALLIAQSLLYFSFCDIPVHCTSAEGEWTFKANTVSSVFDLTNASITCGHGFPDRVEKSNNKPYSLPDYTTEYRFKLSRDHRVYKNDQICGTYTLVYDEGFIIKCSEIEIFVYFRYYWEPKSAAFKSDCNQTMKGWIRTGGNMNNCIYGIKGNGKYSQNTSEKTPESDNDKFLTEQDSTFTKDPLYTGYIQTKALNLKTTSFSNRKYEENKDFVDLINNNSNLTWKAHIFEEFKGNTMLELNKKLGRKRNVFSEMKSRKFSNTKDNIFIEKQGSNLKKSFLQLKSKTKYDDNSNNNRESDSNVVNDYAEISKYIEKDLDDIDERILPKNWDWRNVGGVSYVPGPRRQGECGSCYVFSSMSSLEARLRVKTNNKDRTVFSRQFPISCNFYTEGCDGGYPVLVAKFSHEFELIPESCFPYKESNVSCSNVCDYKANLTKYYVSKYGYIGGYYGATNELLMLKELRARGPIPGNIAVPWSFSYYKRGIYSDNKPLTKNSGMFRKTTLSDEGISWEKVDHSILIVGYGEENGVKYWICMNTWGSQWGEDGYFKILRGENECFIESMGDFLNIDLQSRS